jgi:gamma-glutamylcyclotransferase (GGCT)/AIG2-like uncharacterized protein YtfP
MEKENFNEFIDASSEEFWENHKRKETSPYEYVAPETRIIGQIIPCFIPNSDEIKKIKKKIYIKKKDSFPAVLKAHKLNLIKSGGGAIIANIIKDEVSNVEGMVYYFSPSSFEKLKEFESLFGTAKKTIVRVERKKDGKEFGVYMFANNFVEDYK